MADKVVKIFDASLQEEVDHTVTVDANGEIVATSTESGRFIKFPAGLSASELKAAIKEHKELNEGHEVITPEVLEAQERATQASLDTVDEL